jgi:hypothetical protein
MTESSSPIYRGQVDRLTDLNGHVEDVQAIGKTAKGEREQKAKEIERDILATMRPLLLEVGSPGRLLVMKELESVLPLDNADLLGRAKPVVGGKVVVNPDRVREREAAQVKTVLSKGAFGLVVLGASHDLSGAVRKESGQCEYLRVWVKDLPE